MKHKRDYNASLNILALGINDYLQSSNDSQRVQMAKKQYFQTHYSLASKMLKLPLLATR